MKLLPVLLTILTLGLLTQAPSQPPGSLVSIDQLRALPGSPTLLGFVGGRAMQVKVEGTAQLAISGGMLVLTVAATQLPARQVDSFLINCTSTPATNCTASIPAQVFTTQHAPTEGSIDVYRNGLHLDPIVTPAFADYSTAPAAGGLITVTMAQPTADGDVVTVIYR